MTFIDTDIRVTSIGRIAVPRNIPAGFALFYTSVDFPGWLNQRAVGELLEVVRQLVGVDASLTTCRQVHGAVAREAPATKMWSECDSCDALWSVEKNAALGIKVADCLPVTIVDPANSVIANVHSGWKGTVQRISTETLNTIAAETRFDVASAQVWLGPSIRTCCFEVGDDVVAQFANVYERLDRFVDRSFSKPHLDLAGLTRESLHDAGFSDDRIHDTGLCTRCEGSIFHSFRRDRDSAGRNLAIVAQ